MLKQVFSIVFGLGFIALSFVGGQDQLPTFDEDKSSPEFKEREAKRVEKLMKEIVVLEERHTRSEYVMPFAEALVAGDDFIHGIELSTEQQEKIKSVLTEYNKKLKGIKEKYAQVANFEVRNRLISKEASQLGHACNKILINELIDMQLDVLAEWEPNKIGIAKVLSDSPIGKAIGLSDEQRDQIRKDANALGERMLADFEKYKEEAAKIVFDSLTDEQKDKLSQALDPSGTRPVTALITMRNVHQLACELDYRKDEFDPSKRRTIANGVVYDGYGNKLDEDPEEVKKRLHEKK